MIAPVLALGRPPGDGGAPPPDRILIFTATATLAMAWAVFFIRRMFLRLDEYQQQASRVGWYWGASLGIAVSAPLYMFIILGGLHWLWPANFHLGRDLARAFQIGFMLPIVCQVLGAAVVGVWWRASRR
jgi:hypothetical protein